jgi:broad specificity phosphatase PhoE
MITFLIVRHGISEKTPGDPPLTEDGKKQAETTANYLKLKNVDAICSSPLKRAQETATYISKVLSLGIKLDERLRERINWGDIPEETYENYEKEWRQSTIDRDYNPNNGDSSKSAGLRFQQFLDEITDSKYENVVIVSHSAVIGDVLRNLFTDEYLQTFQQNFPFEPIENCSVTVLKKEKGKYFLDSLGSTVHLPKSVI